MSMADKIHRRVHRTLVFDRRRDRLVRALLSQLPSESSILDVGCGSGEIGSDLVAAGHRVVGVETFAREECAIDMSIFDGQTLPFGDDEFDWVVIVDVLHHASDPDRVVAEARRVSSQGVIVKDHYAENRRQRGVLAAMDWVGNRQFGVGRDGAYLSRAEWAAVWSGAGLRVIDVNESIDLYPGVVKPLFENGLHFVARLEPG